MKKIHESGVTKKPSQCNRMAGGGGGGGGWRMAIMPPDGGRQREKRQLEKRVRVH